MTQLFEAIEFATHAHADQFRKGTRVPYIIHPLNVAKLLIEAECDEDVVIAGLLHDTVEDTKVTIEEIRARYGDAVADLVAFVTEPPRSGFTWEQRKRDTLERMDTAPCAALWLECADKLDNIRQMGQDQMQHGELFWDRFNRPKPYQHWYAASLAQLFLRHGDCDTPNGLFQEYLAQVVELYGDAHPPADLPDMNVKDVS